MNTILSKTTWRALACFGMLLAAGGATAATTTVVNLTAQRMTAALPDGAAVPMWGYCTTGSCSASWSTGPTIVVPYDATGTTLQINLTNSLPVPTSIVILGQLGGGLGGGLSRMAMPQHPAQTQTTWPANATATFTPPTQAARVQSFATEVAANTTTPTTLQWDNLKPGTYIYETGTMPSVQAPMGLYGVLVVTQAPVPAVAADSTASPPVAGSAFVQGNAYPNSTAGVAYDSETSLLFSEIDPVQNAAVDAAAMDGADPTKRFNDATCSPNGKCYPAAVNYTPTYFLINGRSFDTTAPQNSAFGVAGTNTAPGTYASGKVLVRLLNAGLRTHVPSIVGLPMTIVAEDGNLAPGNSKLQNEVLLTAGKTHDVLVSPLAASSGASYFPATYTVFDRQLSLSTANQPDGGMQGFLEVANAGSLTALPTAVTPTAVDDNYKVPLNASINGNVKLNDIAVGSVAVVTGPTHGTVVLNPDGTFVYTPTTGYVGSDTFTYLGNPGPTPTNTATVTLNVASAGVGSAPTANADTYTSSVSTMFRIAGPGGVLANDTDPSGYPLTATSATNVNCGSVTLNPDGSFTATKGAGNSCQFTYVAQNSQGTPSTPATVTVNFIAAGMATGLNVAVADAVTGAPITDYRWIIQEDLTFKVDPTATPSISTRTLGTSFHTSYMPVVATGCVGDVSCGVGQSVRGIPSAGQPSTLPSAVALDPAKRYYISILPGDAANGAGSPPSVPPGHTMGGANIAPGQTAVNVAVNSLPLVTAQLSIYIYEDNNPINGQNDLAETGLGGFNIILMDAVGRSGDPAGQQTYDALGMPMSNWLLGKPGCPDDLNKNTNGTATSSTGNKVGVIYTCPNAPPGYTGNAAVDYALAGHALIKNITPARYDVIAHPGAAREGAGEVWWQTETLEGTPAQDAFAGVKEPVYFQEFGPPGFHTTIGFVNPANVRAVGDALRASLHGAPTYSITGKVTNQHMSRPSDVTLWDSGSYDLLNSTVCQVALNSSGGTGAAIAITSCDTDGNFKLTGVPAGSYEIAIWDQWLDQIIQTQAVTVTNADVALLDIPVLTWFTQYQQNIFLDLNGNGIFDGNEPGISNLTMTTRYRDGGISNVTATDSTGNAILAELFPLFNWYVTEADTTRFKQSGVNVIVDGGGKPDTGGDGAGLYSSTYATGGTTNRVEIPGALSYGLQGFIGQRNTINWGRTPYVPNENGGITGKVVYSTTRAFDDQRYNVQTIWEPLVPRATVNLYRKDKLADGTDTLTLVDTTKTSSWDDFVNQVDANGKQVNLQCPGQLTTDPFYVYTLGGTDQGRCYDGWHNWNQVQAAPYDGRYAFPSADYIKNHPLPICTLADKTQCPTLVSLPPGKYVVEAVTPPGYEVVKEEDKNILTGDAFIASVPQQFGALTNIFILPDQATLNNANPYNTNNATTNLGVTAPGIRFPECVGSPHRVPDFLSVFPATGLVAPFAGMDRPLCDRKLVALSDQTQTGADFFVFTQVPAAAAGAGIILDDASSEFNSAAPDFGEKASVPFVPVSIKDFNGREIGRSYSDQWGAYNVLTPSSWLVNPPTPSGYGPNMLVACINDPGPIKDPTTGQMVTDPQYSAAYSNFCYTVPFMPGRTNYLDTPVLPIAAFASASNQADCEYPDVTPAISRVDSSAGFGPYLPATGGTLTITAMGDRNVPNPAYAGPFALTGPTSQRTVTRHYDFRGGKGSVKIGNVTIPDANVAWSNTSIVVNVPAGTPSGELVITDFLGNTSVDTVTVTVEANAPTRVQAATGGTIQAAIDAATPGDLILIDAGTYNELVVMWKPVRLQGVGAASVIVNAAKYPTSKLATWRPMINSLFSIDITTGNQTGTSQVDPLPTQEITGGVVLLEPSVLGSEEGAGITVLAKNLPAGQCTGGALSVPFGKPVTDSNFLCAPSRIDGISVTGGDAGGGIFVNGWAHNLEIANNRVYGNAGAYHGGVRVGVPYLEEAALPVTGALNTVVGFGYDNNVKIHHNAITKNGTVEPPAGSGGAGGGVSICTGTDGYSVDHNWICGNISASDGGGIGHIGFSQGGKIASNKILFNQSFQQTSSTHGGGIVVTGEPPLAGALTLGTGNLSIDANLIRGNFAEGGHGGGIRLQQVNGADVALHPNAPGQWFSVSVTNNMIDNNVAGYAGGGISLADTLVSKVDNNTVSANDSVGIAGSVLAGGVPLPGASTGVAGTGKPSPAGISSDPTSAALMAVVGPLPDLVLTKSQKAISAPELINNIVWKNRSFFYKVVSGNSTLCSSNNVADTVGTTCNQLPDQATTGQCTGAPAYWDLGVLGDATPTPVIPPPVPIAIASYTASASIFGARLVTIATATPHGLTTLNTVIIAGFNQAPYNGAHVVTVTSTTKFTYILTGTSGTLPILTSGTATPPAASAIALNPTYSILTSTTGYTGAGLSSSDPLLADAYCNGARATPEYPAVINPPTKMNLQVAATADEGNNYVNLRYGPLYLTKPAATKTFGDYHIASLSPAIDKGTTLAGVTHDFDGDARPQGPAYDIGADEFTLSKADLSITVTDGVTTVNQGGAVTYTIVVANAGPGAVTAATVTDNFPATLTVTSWTCVASTGSSCTVSGTGVNRAGAVTLPNGGSATFTAVAALSATATGNLVNTATVTPPATISDPNPANNSATDTDTIIVPRPTLSVLDNFNRAAANTLGSSWSQATLLGVAAIRLVDATPGNTSTGLANANIAGNAYWNVTPTGFGAKQGAALTIANTTLNGDSLILKATGTVTLGVAQNFIRVNYTGAGNVVVSTTTNFGVGTTSSVTLNNANSTFANGDTMTALVDATGALTVWKNTTLVGTVTLPNVALWTTGGGRIGIDLQAGARVDNFAGGTVP